MANYTVRLELQGGSPADYDQLHKLMLYAGFARAIEDHDGEWWQLPTAEFLYVTHTRSCEQICELAKAIADRVKLGAWVLVSETTRRAWRTGTRRGGARPPSANANEISSPQAQGADAVQVPMLKFRTRTRRDWRLPDHA